METTSSLHAEMDRPSGSPSLLRTVGAVAAALVAWILVASIINRVLRVSWPPYHQAEIAFNFTLAMKLARLTMGAISSLVAGFVAAWIGKGRLQAPTLTALLLLALFIPDHYLIWNKFPVWYHLTFLVSLLPLTLLGAALRQTSMTRTKATAGE